MSDHGQHPRRLGLLPGDLFQVVDGLFYTVFVRDLQGSSVNRLGVFGCMHYSRSAQSNKKAKRKIEVIIFHCFVFTINVILRKVFLKYNKKSKWNRCFFRVVIDWQAISSSKAAIAFFFDTP